MTPIDLSVADLLLAAGKDFAVYADGLAEAKAVSPTCPSAPAACPYANCISHPIACYGCMYDASDIPFAYFAQFALDVEGVAMVTASHNDNGWTGIKMGFNRPLTFGPDEMSALKQIVLNGECEAPGGGRYVFVSDLADRYFKALTDRPKLKRKLKVVAACGNGTAGAFAPKILEALGCDVVPLDCDLDFTFPRYNPNPEDMEMLHAMSEAVLKHKADIGFGFDGDGDRCGVVDNAGHEIFADKAGVMLARDLSKQHANAVFVADVKSTGLFVTDPVLKANGAKALYWKTGHSYMKRYTHEQKALVGFEKSGHFFFQPPLGKGYDDGLVSAIAFLDMLDRNPDKTLEQLKNDLPKTWQSPTMSPHCGDEVKYGVVDRITGSPLSQVFFWDWRAPNYFWKQLLSGAAIAVVMTGLDQNNMQKTLSCRTLGESQRNLYSFGVILVLVNACFFALGVLLYEYTTAQGLPVPAATDQLFPQLALRHLGGAAALVFVLGLTAATFNSADSVLTTLTTSFCIDFLGFERRTDLTPAAQTRWRHGAHFVFAVILLAAILLFRALNQGAVIELVLNMAGYTYGPLLGLFALGLFTRIRVGGPAVPLVCLAVPILCSLLAARAPQWLRGYRFGFELLILNGLLVAGGLAAFARRPETPAAPAPSTK